MKILLAVLQYLGKPDIELFLLCIELFLFLYVEANDNADWLMV